MSAPSRTSFPTGALELPRYELGEEVATRKAYGDALAALGAADGRVVALDGEVSNSTYAEIFGAAHPERFFEMFIAEQQLVAAAVGLQVRGWKPFASTFAAFFTRAYDFIRMAAVSRATIALCGLARRRLDRRGRPVADGARGPGDDARRRRQHRALPVRREPDGEARRRRWPSSKASRYLRTTRGATPVLYEAGRASSRSAAAGSSAPRTRTTSRSSPPASPSTRRSAAADDLADEGISARVIDCYSVKPIDRAGLRDGR